MRNCGTCYHRDSTWSPQHAEISARCDHENVPGDVDSLLTLRVGAGSEVPAPGWCPMEPKFELHPILKDASLERACELANNLTWGIDGRVRAHDPVQIAADLSYMLEYLRLNFDLVEKK